MIVRVRPDVAKMFQDSSNKRGRFLVTIGLMFKTLCEKQKHLTGTIFAIPIEATFNLPRNETAWLHSTLFHYAGNVESQSPRNWAVGTGEAVACIIIFMLFEIKYMII